MAALGLAAALLGFLWALATVSSQGFSADAPERHPRLESALHDLAVVHQVGSAAAVAGAAERRGVDLEDGLVRVIVVAEDRASRPDIAALGGRVEREAGLWIQARVPLNALLPLADAPGVRFIRRPWRSLPAVVSEGVTRTLATDWHGSGLDGKGVKVGVLDLGFMGYKTRITGGELPTDVITRSFVGGGSQADFWNGSSHGVACAEIVHDMAPGAQLYLVNFGTEVEWSDAVDWLVAQGVDLISFSAGWPLGGPGDGSGQLAEKVTAVRDAGVLWVNAAGNSAQRHWMGSFTNPDPHEPGDPRWHNFSGTDETNEMTVTGDFDIVIGLRWDDAWGESANDYDLFLFRDQGGELNEVARSENVQNGDDDPLEVITYNAPPSGVYHIAISKQADALIRTLELFSYYQDLQYRTVTSSLAVPADSPGSLTVAATYWADDVLEDFSARGPTRDGRLKPDLAAPDGVGVSTEAYAGGFYGTSASAPHVAGAAALAMETLPSLTPTGIQTWLEDRALDLGEAGKDKAFGAGRLNLAMIVRPGAAMQGTTLTLEISAIPFSPSATFRLTMPGEADLLPDEVNRLSISRLSGTVALQDTLVGSWAVVVSNSSTISATLPDAFLVASDQFFLPLILRTTAPND